MRLRRGHGAHCRTEQQEDVPRSEQSQLSLRQACCESVTAVTRTAPPARDASSRRRVARATRAIFGPASPSQWEPRPRPLGGAPAPTGLPLGGAPAPTGLPLGSHWEFRQLPVGVSQAPTGSFASSQWEFRKLPLGVSQAPTGSFASSQWAFRKSQWESQWELPVGISKCASKSEWAHGGGGSRRAGWRLARRGGPHRVPLGGASGSRATIVPAPLPVPYLPRIKDFPP